ncbi:MAG: KUP/HAK/KT family potassium transporter, partial [Ignavibacteriaceae bacterium]
MTEQQQTVTEKRKLTKLSIAALGVVFGDIGTSPLYAIRECFHGEFAIGVNTANVYGVLSLMVWALILIVSIKYLSFILRADNNGEGGVLALTALVRPLLSKKISKSGWLLISLGIFAGALLYGDGMITPA